MNEITIQYKDGEGNTTERIISEYLPGDFPYTINAFCHLRKETRTFVLSRILHAYERNTGKVIDDIYDYFGVIKPINNTEEFIIQYKEKPEELVKRRKKEKYELIKQFKLNIIVDFYKKKFYSLFNNRCYKCSKNELLVIDHHIPMILGGRMLPGNLVALCTKCNSKKGRQHPDMFYTKQELLNLKEIFEKEKELFSFRFDWKAWNNSPRKYLDSIGIDKDLIDEAFLNPNSPFYIDMSQEDEKTGFSFNVDLADIISDVDK